MSTTPVIPIRIDPALKATFIRLCKEQDTTASREVRKFIRDYVAKHSTKGEQSELF